MSVKVYSIDNILEQLQIAIVVQSKIKILV